MCPSGNAKVFRAGALGSAAASDTSGGGVAVTAADGVPDPARDGSGLAWTVEAGGALTVAETAPGWDPQADSAKLAERR